VVPKALLLGGGEIGRLVGPVFVEKLTVIADRLARFGRTVEEAQEFGTGRRKRDDEAGLARRRGGGLFTVPTIAIYKGVVPFICLQLIALVLVYLYPDLATWLPRAIGW